MRGEQQEAEKKRGGGGGRNGNSYKTNQHENKTKRQRWGGCVYGHTPEKETNQKTEQRHKQASVTLCMGHRGGCLPPLTCDLSLSQSHWRQERTRMTALATVTVPA